MHKGPVKEYGGGLTYGFMYKPIKMFPKQKREKKKWRKKRTRGESVPIL